MHSYCFFNHTAKCFILNFTNLHNLQQQHAKIIIIKLKHSFLLRNSQTFILLNENQNRTEIIFEKNEAVLKSKHCMKIMSNVKFYGTSLLLSDCVCCMLFSQRAAVNSGINNEANDKTIKRTYNCTKRTPCTILCATNAIAMCSLYTCMRYDTIRCQCMRVSQWMEKYKIHACIHAHTHKNRKIEMIHRTFEHFLFFIVKLANDDNKGSTSAYCCNFKYFINPLRVKL